MSTTDANIHWYWSQNGVTLGPVDIDEIRRLIASGSIRHATYVYDPAQAAWVTAGSVPGLFTGPSIAPPPDAGARAPFAAPAPPAASIDPRSAAIICRVSVMIAPFMNVIAAVGPAVVWAMSPRDARVVSEAKAALNCLIVAFLGSLIAGFIAIVGALCVVGPFIGVPMLFGIGIYLVVNGIRGLMAASDDRPFSYPWIPVILR